MHPPAPGSPGLGDGCSVDISIPVGFSSLQAAFAVLECLVKDHGGAVTEANVHADGTAGFVVRVPA
jgi:hypothetical protein